MDVLKKFGKIEPLIGHTPLLEISFRYNGKTGCIYAKDERYNLTGSVKDRVALYVLRKAIESGELGENDTIVEATSGNTGISFSALGAIAGRKVIIYMPDWMSRERIVLMQSYGAEVRLVSKQEGGFLGSIAKTEELAKQGGVFLPKQFSNPLNSDAHYYGTGAEIVKQLASLGLKADGVVAGVGTGGTIMGIARALRDANPACKAFPLEPESSPTLSTGYKVGAHRIQGISDEFIPDLCKLDQLDDVVAVDDGDAINMARKLSKQLALGVGVSSGANFIGVVKAWEKLGGNAVMTTVFSDDNKKYLSTDYAVEQEPKDHFLFDKIELLGVKAIGC